MQTMARHVSSPHSRERGTSGCCLTHSARAPTARGCCASTSTLQPGEKNQFASKGGRQLAFYDSVSTRVGAAPPPPPPPPPQPHPPQPHPPPNPTLPFSALGGLEAWGLQVDSLRDEDHTEARIAEEIAAATPLPADALAGQADGEEGEEVEAAAGVTVSRVTTASADPHTLAELEALLAQLRTLPAAVQDATVLKVRVVSAAGAGPGQGRLQSRLCQPLCCTCVACLVPASHCATPAQLRPARHTPCRRASLPPPPGRRASQRRRCRCCGRQSRLSPPLCCFPLPSSHILPSTPCPCPCRCGMP